LENCIRNETRKIEVNNECCLHDKFIVRSTPNITENSLEVQKRDKISEVIILQLISGREGGD
jgi:hypothetical protein